MFKIVGLNKTQLFAVNHFKEATSISPTQMTLFDLCNYMTNLFCTLFSRLLKQQYFPTII